MNVTGKITVKLRPTSQIIARLGLDASGAVQKFHTQNCLRRIIKYMPYRTGSTIKLTVIQTSTDIATQVPYARYLFYGKVMAGKAPKYVTGKDLAYTTTKNPRAGPRWDRALVAAEGKALTADLQRYINLRG